MIDNVHSVMMFLLGSQSTLIIQGKQIARLVMAVLLVTMMDNVSSAI